MIESLKCSSCGSDIEQDVPFRECPKCLLDLGIVQDSTLLDESQEDRRAQGLPDYELLEAIGRGGMGIVYRARQLSLDRTVAIKFIGGGDFASPAAWARFRREAEAAAKLDHPHIVPIYEVGEHNGNPFLVMRFVEGASLADQVAHFSGKGSRGQIEIAKLMALLARAVHYAHERGVLHRDLKPSNILLDREGLPHLTDFGIAKLLDQEAALTQTAELLGTPFYMSPEQAAGKSISAATDIYSLGVILYELLTGRRPFEADRSVEVLQKVMTEEPLPLHSLNSSVDRDLATICLKCLDKDPSRRYSSALALGEDVERWLRREPIRARPAGAPLRFRRWTVRNPALATLIAGLIVGIGLTLGLLAKANHEKARKSVALAILRTETARQLQEIWASGSEFFAINSETLAAMAGKEPTRLQAGEERFTMAFVAEGNPLGGVLNAAPLLEYVEHNMATKSHIRARVDLRLYKTQSRAAADLIGGGVDLMLMNARDYVRAKMLGPGLEPLARDIPSLGAADVPRSSAVLFTRADSGIKRLGDLRGRSFLFGTADSTATFWAKVCLAQAGIHAADLVKFGYLDRPAHIPSGLSRESAEAETTDLGNPFSDMTPVEAVLDGTYDAAVANERRVLQVAAREKLVLLARFQDSGSVLVRRSKLAPNSSAAFQRAMIRLADSQILQLFPGAPRGFALCSDADFASLRDNLRAESAFGESSITHLSPAQP